MNWKFWEKIMRKRNKPTIPPPTPVTADQLLEPQSPVAEPQPEPPEKVGETAVVEPEPPAPPPIYMLWCPACGRVGLHATDDCDGEPVSVRYEAKKRSY